VLEEYRKPAAAASTVNRPFRIPHYKHNNEERVVREENLISYHLLPMSAATLAHLRLYCEKMADYLCGPAAASLADICGTIAHHRSEFPSRKCFVATTREEMAQQLNTFAKSGGSPPQPFMAGSKARVAFVFTGQGSQWEKCGMELMVFPAYRHTVEKVDAVFKSLSGWSILRKLHQLTTEEMRATLYAQPITFLLQVKQWWALLSI